LNEATPPAGATPFEVATAVWHEGDGFRAELSPTWTVGSNPHGGYLLATLARAALATEPTGAHPHPLTASALYLSPPTVGPADITVEVLRRGRSASHLRARLAQAGQIRVEALFTVGRLDGPDEPSWIAEPPIEVAPPAQCRVSPIQPSRGGLRVNMLGLIEQRLDMASLGSRETTGAEPFRRGSGEVRGWLRFRDGTGFDPLSLLYAADGFPPATFTLGSVGWVPTMELTVYLRGLPAPGSLRVRQRVRVLSGSRVDQVCEIWDSRDRIVAQATQLAAVRMAPPRP
jgi:Thioesterase-like superfamily